MQVVVADPRGVELPDRGLEEVKEVQGQPVRPVQRNTGEERTQEDLSRPDTRHPGERRTLILLEGGEALEEVGRSRLARGERALLPTSEGAGERTTDHPAVEGSQHDLAGRPVLSFEFDPMNGAEGVAFHLLLDADHCHGG